LAAKQRARLIDRNILVEFRVN